jgi:hypothetical protein
LQVFYLQIDGVVEAAGVELFRVLITRNLLILGTATTAKKASLLGPLGVYCTRILFPRSRIKGRHKRVSHSLRLFRREIAAPEYQPAAVRLRFGIYAPKFSLHSKLTN